MNVESIYQQLTAHFEGAPGIITPGAGPSQGFGNSALTVNNKVFAKLVRGKLVVKLPEPRVDELVGDRTGRRVDANTATEEKEWLAVHAADEALWIKLADEAFAYVGTL